MSDPVWMCDDGTSRWSTDTRNPVEIDTISNSVRHWFVSVNHRTDLWSFLSWTHEIHWPFVDFKIDNVQNGQIWCNRSIVTGRRRYFLIAAFYSYLRSYRFGDATESPNAGHVFRKNRISKRKHLLHSCHLVCTTGKNRDKNVYVRYEPRDYLRVEIVYAFARSCVSRLSPRRTRVRGGDRPDSGYCLYNRMRAIRFGVRLFERKKITR